MKKNIEPISSALSTVDKLCGVCFDLCEDDRPSIGLLAQDVENVLPRVVTKDERFEEHDDIELFDKYCIDDAMYGLNYAGFTPVLIEAVKEEHVCIKELQTQLGEQCGCVLCLQQQIDELKNLINNG
jgi:hypothetical protein